MFSIYLNISNYKTISVTNLKAVDPKLEGIASIQ